MTQVLRSFSRAHAWPLGACAAFASLTLALGTEAQRRSDVSPSVEARIAESVPGCEVLEVRTTARASRRNARESSVLEITRPDRVVTPLTVFWITNTSTGEKNALSVKLDCEPPVLTPGDTIRISYSTGAVRIETVGQVREAARIGDRVNVRTQSGTLLRVRIVSSAHGEVVQ